MTIWSTQVAVNMKTLKLRLRLSCLQTSCHSCCVHSSLGSVTGSVQVTGNWQLIQSVIKMIVSSAWSPDSLFFLQAMVPHRRVIGSRQRNDLTFTCPRTSKALSYKLLPPLIPTCQTVSRQGSLASNLLDCRSKDLPVHFSFRSCKVR